MVLYSLNEDQLDDKSVFAGILLEFQKLLDGSEDRSNIPGGKYWRSREPEPIYPGWKRPAGRRMPPQEAQFLEDHFNIAGAWGTGGAR